MNDPVRYGVVCDLDGMLGLVSPRAVWRRVGGLLSPEAGDRRSVLGVSGLLRALQAQFPGLPVYYLSCAPRVWAGSITSRLVHDGFPAGTLLMPPRAGLLGALVPDEGGRRRAVDQVVRREPHRRWVLVGDDGGADPDVFAAVAAAWPEALAALALRQVGAPPPPERTLTPPPESIAGVPVVRAPNGDELLPLLRRSLGLPTPRGDGPGGAARHWLLSDAERGNQHTRLRAWTEGNAVRALVHGRSYFPVLADTVDSTDAGDVVAVLGWRADADERLTADRRTVGAVLAASAHRGALVRGLLWRSHLSILGYSATENRRLARRVNSAGGRFLLDQRVRPLGSHHEKLTVVRHREHPRDDVAFIGGVDLCRTRGDDAGHGGDRQTLTLPRVYGPHPAWHDVQLELRGPVVREAEDVFRERWEDGTALSRLPWHVLSDLLHRMPRRAVPLPPPAPDPPQTGGCAVQLLRTRPRRHPPHPSAPRGERSIARGYAKALQRAQRLVYVEDQYLWSMDVARVFATALRRAPRLHLIAVVPRHLDQAGRIYSHAARLGHAGALGMVHEAGGDRVQVLDVEVPTGRPVYVHAKVCIIDDVWAAVGSANFNSRSWTHDSEVGAAVLDEERDSRTPADPGGLGDGARSFARGLRLELMREHLARDDDADLLDPDRAAAVVRRSAAALDVWYADGRRGPRPPGRLRTHVSAGDARRPGGGDLSLRRRLTALAYRSALDPDGRPLGLRLRRGF